MLQDTNKKFSAAIGEPWDFKSADGENILKDTINKVLTVNGDTILFAHTSDFFYEGIKITDVCNGDGGMKDHHEKLFALRNKHYRFTNKEELLSEVDKLVKVRSFESKNGNFKLGFDFYINCNDKYFVLCPELNQGYYAKLNFLNRSLGFLFYQEPWENKKFGYWERVTR